MLAALGEVGVKEATGANDGERVEEYLASTSLGKGNPWCSAFIHWSYRECGIIHEPRRDFAMALQWNKKNVIWRKEGWEPDIGDWRRISKDGDLGMLWYSNLGRIAHAFVIIGEEEDYCRTIEGNTSVDGVRDGGGVYIRRRLKRSIYSISRW